MGVALLIDLAACYPAYRLTVGQGGKPVGAGDSPIDFGRDLLRYLYGAPAFEYFTTPAPPFWVHLGDAVAALLAAFAIYGLVLAAREDRHARRYIAGYAAMLLAVWFIGGCGVLAAGTSRYGLSLVVPSLFFAAMGWERFSSSVRVTGPWLSFAAAAAFLVAFDVGFIRAEERDGSANAHPTYWTGTEEPKVAAYRKGLEVLGAEGKIHVDEWWTYYPIRFLDGAHQPERVEWHKGFIDGAALGRQIGAGDVAIGFAGSRLDNMLRPQSATLTRTVWHTPSGKETVALWSAKAAE